MTGIDSDSVNRGSTPRPPANDSKASRIVSLRPFLFQEGLLVIRPHRNSERPLLCQPRLPCLPFASRRLSLFLPIYNAILLYCIISLDVV